MPVPERGSIPYRGAENWENLPPGQTNQVLQRGPTGDPEWIDPPTAGPLEISNFPAVQPVSGTVAVSNLPVTQPVSGAVSVSNLPATQPVSGTVAISNLPATQPVSGTVAVSNLPATQATRDLKDTGRTSIALLAEAVAGATSEGLITLTQSRGGAATSTGTSYNVTAGKTFRLQALVVSWVATTTTANTSRVRLRVNAGGAAVIGSPLQLSFRLAWESPTFIANEGKTVVLEIPDGFELPGGAGLAVTHQEAAANGTLDISLWGYEF